MAIINFAAERCELITVCKGKKGHYIFEKGITTSRTIDIALTEGEFTEIFIKPDNALFENLTFTIDGINERAKQVNTKLTDLKIIIHNNIKVD